jgi:hypothetical protein
LTDSRSAEQHWTEGDPEFAIDRLFAHRPKARHLFDVVRGVVNQLGPVRIEGMKTQVSFGNGRKFAWVWLPQMWIGNQPEESITLTFALDHRIEHPRIKEVLEPYPGRWTHHVVINVESEIDDTLRRWLRKAYEWSAAGRGRS